MTILAIALGLGLVAAVGAVIWLLVQRGPLAARAAAAESARADAEARLAQRDAEIRAAAERAQHLVAESAGLRARVESIEEAREAEQAAAARALSEAVENERRAGDLRLSSERAVIAKERESLAEARRQTLADLAEMKQQAQAAFKALAGETLKQTNEQFLHLAEQKLLAKTGEATAEMEKRQRAVEQMVKPIGEKLAETAERLGRMEKDQAAHGATLQEQVRQMAQANDCLRQETGRLVQALRDPKMRGRAGEMQLKRVLDVAGLRGYCDFDEQDSTRDADGNLLRPDLVMKLPSGRHLVVDAKANLLPYLEAHETQDPDARDACLKRFADGIAAQAADLAKKNYWKQYDGSPEIVVMFVPGDQLVDMALSKRPDLLEFAASHGVILASPGSLIGLFRAVQVGFREQRVTDEARAIQGLARELHQRIGVLFGHLDGLGDGIKASVRKFNDAVGSIDTRLMPTLRRIEASGINGEEPVPQLEPLTITVRENGQGRMPA